MNEFNEFINKIHFEQIPIKNLVSNQGYQRNISEQNVQKAVKDFDPYQIKPIKISRRDGINYVFDGQHTIEIIAAVTKSRETPVWCMVYDDLKYIREADIFANQQKYVKRLTSYEIFIANIEAQNEEQLIIKDLVESYNLTLSSNKAPGNICAISTLEYIYRTFGYHILDKTLALCIATWEGEVNSLSANILKGIAKLLVTYSSKIDEFLFKEKLSAVSIKEITRMATERGNGSLGFAEAMLYVYNRRLRNPLHISELYSKRKVTAPDFMQNETFSDFYNQEDTENIEIK